MKHTVTPENIDAWVEFDSPFRVNFDGTVERVDSIYAPSVYHVDGEREPDVDGSGWEFMDGYSGQHGYPGPVMHVSEFLGGRMADDVLANPGVYVICAVEDMDDLDNPAGWVLLRRENTP